jgi:uncharacterized protein (DUF2141 family)
MTAACLSFLPGDSGTLIVRVHNLEKKVGNLRLAVYHSPSTFLNEGLQLAERTIPIRTDSAGRIDAELPGLAFGVYAIAIFHDLNDNGELDTNLFGIPTEPYAFSNNPSAKWRSPRFEEARFDFPRHQQVMEVELRRWKER